MKLRRRAMVVGVAVATLLIGTAATVAGASAGARGHEPERHGDVLRSALVGRPVGANTTVPIRGVPPGGVAWALSGGTVRLSSAGRLSLEVEGLVITGTNTKLDGTTGPVTAIVAALTCEGTSPTIVSSTPVPLSSRGNAAIEQRITLPATCLAPIVLVRANSSSGPWIAATGF
jgi:hypothetical protein